MTWNTNIKEINLNEVPFSNDKLEFLNTSDIEIGEQYIGSVDLSLVVGTDHLDYAEKTQKVVFQNLKRATRNIVDLKKSPEYYFKQVKKKDWSFYKIDEQYFISKGNHRTVIGRFFFYLTSQKPVIHGVSITEAKLKAKAANRLKRMASTQHSILSKEHDVLW